MSKNKFGKVSILNVYHQRSYDKNLVMVPFSRHSNELPYEVYETMPDTTIVTYLLNGELKQKTLEGLIVKNDLKNWQIEKMK